MGPFDADFRFLLGKMLKAERGDSFESGSYKNNVKAIDLGRSSMAWAGFKAMKMFPNYLFLRIDLLSAV